MLYCIGLAVSGISSQSPGKPIETILPQIYSNQTLGCPKAEVNTCPIQVICVYYFIFLLVRSPVIKKP